MALNRGKQYTETPSGSAIRVNVPDYNVLGSAISVFDEKVKIDARREELNFQRENINLQRDQAYKDAEIKTEEQKQKLIIQEEEDKQKAFADDMKAHQDLMEEQAKAKIDRQNAINEISAMKHTNALVQFVFDLEREFPNNPEKISKGINEYYNKITNDPENKKTWLSDGKAFYKFEEKYLTLYRSAVGEASKNLDTFVENTQWDELNTYAGKLNTQMAINISRIESEADLPQFLETITADTHSLQNHINEFASTWGFKLNKNQGDFDKIMYDFIANRDTLFTSHIINKFVLGDQPTEQNISMAYAILEHIKQNKLPKAFQGDPVHPNTPYNQKGAMNILHMISDFTNSTQTGTIDNYQPDDRNRIIDNISNSIENAENDYKKRLQQEQLAWLSNIEETTDRYLDNNSKEWVGSLNSAIVSKGQLETQILKQENGFLVPDDQKIKQILKLQQSKLDLGKLVGEVYKGNMSRSEISNRLAGIDLKSLGYQDGDVNSVYQIAIEQAFGGEAFDPVNLFSNIMKDGAFITDANMEQGINMMKKFNYWHPKLTDVLKTFENSEFENEKDAEFLVAFAHVKNRVLGTNDAATLPENYSDALDDVLADYKITSSYSQAVNQWKEDINPKYSDMKKINEAVDNWWTAKSNFTGFTGKEMTKIDFMKDLSKAISREDWTHIRGLIDFFTPKFWETTDLDNLVKNKDTFGLFTDMWNFIMLGDAMDVTSGKDINYTISESASDWIQHYVKEKMPDFLKGITDPDESDFQRAYDAAFKDGIKAMSNNNRFKFSTILYDPSTPYGFVLTENRPEDLIMNGALAGDPLRILTNATAYVGQLMFRADDQNELAFSVFGKTAEYTSIEEKNALFRDFMALSTNGGIKLLPVQDQKDLTNPAYHIMLDVDGDGTFTVLTKDGKEVEWTPNKQYTDSPFGLTYDQVAQKWATDLIDGKTGIGSYNLESIAESAGVDMNNLSGEDRADMIKILTKMIHSDSKFRDVFSGLLFFNDDVAGGDANIDTLSEFHSKLVLEFDDYRKSVNDEVNYAFDTAEEGFVFNHKTKYDQNLFEMAEGPSKMLAQKENTAIATKTYDEIYSFEKSNIIVPPRYKFIITDIIEALPNKWQQLVGEGTIFHDAMMNEDYLDAGDQLTNMKSFFNEEGQLQRLNDLINYWGMSFNKP